MSSSDSLFIAHTPYHALLSYAIAAENNPAHLFVRPTSRNYLSLVELLTSTSIFDSHRILADPYREGTEHGSNRYRKRTIRKNIETIRSFLQTTEVEAIYSALDEREIVQAAMHFAKKYGKGATGIHFEDGCYDYNPIIIEWIPYRSELLRKVELYLRYGFVWDSPPHVRGAHEDITQAYATFPEYVRPELQHQPVHPIPRDGLLELGRQPQLTDYFEDLGLSPEQLSSVDALVLVPFRDAAGNEEVKAIFEKAVEFIEAAGYTVGLKYHPRQTLESRMELDAGPEVVEIPPDAPVELALVAAASSVEVVLGLKSTAMKSALWLLDEPKVFSLYPCLHERGLDYDDWDRSALMEMFDDLGAHLLTDVSQITEYL